MTQENIENEKMDIGPQRKSTVQLQQKKGMRKAEKEWPERQEENGGGADWTESRGRTDFKKKGVLVVAALLRDCP